jgi:CIC family chloride channel protein
VTPTSAQPNVPGRGIVASYGARFWTLVALVGIGAGLGGALLMELLRGIQHLAWSYHAGPLEGENFLEAVEHSSAERRVLVLALGGLAAGGGALLLARVKGVGDVSEAIWLRKSRLPLLGSLARAAHSIVIVGLGASLGREAAPQQAGAAVASTLSDWARLPDWQRRLLVACGAGAGMAAVYNVPLGGALFALEVLLGTLTLPLVLPALATAAIATAVAWIALPTHATYTIPSYGVSGAQVVWAAIIGPIAGLAAVAYIRLIAGAHALRPAGWMRLAAPIVVFTALGAVAIAYPQILGNGRNVVQLALVARLSVVLLAVLLVLKPLATAACLGSGAPGGLFTPTLAYGALLGGLLGEAWSQIWPGAPLGGYAIIGGAAVLGASMQGPLAAVVLLLELTHRADGLMVPVLLAVVEATVLARILGAPSIYSARLAVPAGAVAAPGAPAPESERAGGLEQALQAPSDLLPSSMRTERPGS